MVLIKAIKVLNECTELGGSIIMKLCFMACRCFVFGLIIVVFQIPRSIGFRRQG